MFFGLGNRDRSDDGAGSLLAAEIAGSLEKSSRLTAVDCASTPENNLRVLEEKKPDKLLVVDAVNMEEQPGKIKIVDPDQMKLSGFSTHTCSIEILLEHIKSRFEVDIMVVGIQPENIELSGQLSEPVSNALEEIKEIISSSVN